MIEDYVNPRPPGAKHFNPPEASDAKHRTGRGFESLQKGFEPSGSEWRAGGTPEPRGGPPAGGESRQPYQKRDIRKDVPRPLPCLRRGFIRCAQIVWRRRCAHSQDLSKGFFTGGKSRQPSQKQTPRVGRLFLGLRTVPGARVQARVNAAKRQSFRRTRKNFRPPGGGKQLLPLRPEAGFYVFTREKDAAIIKKT